MKCLEEKSMWAQMKEMFHTWVGFEMLLICVVLNLDDIGYISVDWTFEKRVSGGSTVPFAWTKLWLHRVGARYFLWHWYVTY